MIRWSAATVAFLGLCAGCSANGSGDLGGAGSGGSAAGGSHAGGSGGTVVIPDGGGGAVCEEGNDGDNDGWTIAQGDCNDCSPQINPGAYDFPDNQIDEDCSGTPDDEPVGCDHDLGIEGNDAMDAARSLGLCRQAEPGAEGKARTWGVVSARWVLADGTTSSLSPHSASTGSCTGQGGVGAPPNALSHGILASFGPNVLPRDGASMVAISSGVAREGVNGDSPGGARMCTKSGSPSGFPTTSVAACPGKTIDSTPVANDPMALELTIRAPTNAKSIAFDFDFYTYEFPGYVCSGYNDFFLALLNSAHPDVPANQNISFDAQGNHVSVNNGFLEVCDPSTCGTDATKCNDKIVACGLGPDQLKGTGFEAHAATGWLQTTSPIVAGEEFTIRFVVWDQDDEMFDSTALVDNFRFELEETQNVETIRPPK